MPVTVKVNGTANSLVHKGSNGISMATIPDVCKTPSPGGPGADPLSEHLAVEHAGQGHDDRQGRRRNDDREQGLGVLAVERRQRRASRAA